MKILQATEEHITGIADLFDQYRQFYHCEPDIELATKFISERMANAESTIFVADDEGAVRGFVQMYPSFDSVEAFRIFILHDLYVDANSRNSGIGAMLMNRAAEYAREQGASRIDLLTEFTNKPGQHLYEKLGYRKVLEEFHTYALRL
jgi:ribosomal protein S18 acetylase RimI-like enzyme